MSKKELIMVRVRRENNSREHIFFEKNEEGQLTAVGRTDGEVLDVCNTLLGILGLQMEIRHEQYLGDFLMQELGPHANR